MSEDMVQKTAHDGDIPLPLLSRLRAAELDRDRLRQLIYQWLVDLTVNGNCTAASWAKRFDSALKGKP